jgi:hypothetical protein
MTFTVSVATGVACVVTVTVYVPDVAGAVYKPPFVIAPPVVDQVTAVFVVPPTVALNCCVPPCIKDAVSGATATVMVGATLLPLSLPPPHPANAMNVNNINDRTSILLLKNIFFSSWLLSWQCCIDSARYFSLSSSHV